MLAEAGNIWAAAGPGCGRMTGRGSARPMDLDELVEHWMLFDDERELLAVERVRREARRTRTRRARGRRRPCPGCIRGVRRPAPGRRRSGYRCRRAAPPRSRPSESAGTPAW